MRRRSGVQNGDHGTQDSPPLDEAGLKEAYLKSRRRKVSKRFVDSPMISIETHKVEMVSERCFVHSNKIKEYVSLLIGLYKDNGSVSCVVI